jgi:hypothetical protein
MNTFYIISYVGFPLLAVIFFFLFMKELKRAINGTTWPEERKKKTFARISMGLFVWTLIVSVVALTGFTSQFQYFPLNVMPMVVTPLVIVLILVFSDGAKTVLGQTNLKVITQLQVFRVFVEILLWLLFIQNLLPVQMTFEGRNFDILAGITSLIAARWILHSRGGMIAWNIFGLMLLINIVSIAILSMPTPLRVFENEPANTLVTQFPFVFLPTFLVPLAYILHFLSLRKLLMKS